MKILLTGGAGFIGSNLAGALLRRGDKVIVLDDFSSGREENIAPFLSHADFKLVRGDIRDSAVVDAIMSTGIDAVCHQAAIGSVPRSIDDPVYSLSVNVCGFAQILHSARRFGVKRVVYASSSAVYGDCVDQRKVEDHIGKMLSPYAIGKYADELLAWNFGDLFQLESIGLRYFNVFGRNQSPNGPYAAVIPKFCMELLAHRAPVINGDGSIVRDFTFVDNVVAANCAALDTNDRNAFGSVFNIAGGEKMNLNELFGIIRSELSKFDPAIGELSAIHGPERPGDILQSLAEVSRAAEILHYRPEVSAAAGLPPTAKWYFEHWKEFKNER